MKKALIEKASNRLCQVALAPFPVAPTLEWRDCADDVTPETHFFEGTSFILRPPQPPPIDLSNVDNLEKTFKALALLMRDYCNALQAGTYTQKTVPQLKADFKTRFDALP